MSTRLIMIIVLLVVAVLTARSQDSTRNTGHVIRGTVLDAVSNTPITGATVTVTENGKTIAGAIVKKNGTFRITNVPLGRRVVKITMVGYEPHINDNVLVTAGKEAIVNVTYTTGGEGAFSRGLVYAIKEGKLQRVTEYEGGDKAKGGIIKSNIADGKLDVERCVADETDNSLKIETTTYQLQGNQLTPVDKKRKKASACS